MSTTMKIEIWSDIVCPFCYIGKRNFEKALHDFSNANQIDVEWRSFQLDPSVSSGNKSYPEHLAAKYRWSIEKAKESIASVTAMAKASGLEFNLDNARPYNTTNTHKIIQYAKTKGLGDQIEEAFFKAYFTDEQDLSNEDVLLDIMKSLGFMDTDYTSALNEEHYDLALKSDLKQAQLLGIRGVPFFIFNGKYALSGAQPSQVFTELLNTSFAEWEKDTSLKIFSISDGQSCDINGICD